MVGYPQSHLPFAIFSITSNADKISKILRFSLHNLSRICSNNNLKTYRFAKIYFLNCNSSHLFLLIHLLNFTKTVNFSLIWYVKLSSSFRGLFDSCPLKIIISHHILRSHLIYVKMNICNYINLSVI